MTPLRWVIVFFWLFVAVMLLKTFLDSEAKRKEEIVLHPEQKQFFFTPPPGQAAPVVPSANADVQQTAFAVQEETPPGNFTCTVTVQNVGSKKAENVQVRVRPYRGSSTGSTELGHGRFHLLDENDPLSQMGSWVSFPDLAPGASATQSVVFLNQFNVNPGKNPKPEITFETAKTSP